MKNSDHQDGEEDVESPVTLEAHFFTKINIEMQQLRFLILKPHNGDPDSMLDCSLSYEPLLSCVPYTYVTNTRGNPFASSIIPIDGYGKVTTYNIGVFLRHIRDTSIPLRLWFRDLCVDHNEPAERAAYWTPAWMDKMSQNASDVIDLSEIIAGLWDRGELQRPYQPRPKDYFNVRSGENIQTNHHPIPLGSFRGTDDPPIPHKYLPLDYAADEIRLVSLWKGASANDPLKTTLAYTPMNGPAAYNCLSYTWGAEEATCEILLSGQSFFIRPNLDSFLRAIRSEENKYTFWIDAVSIDQNNFTEKNRQVPRMLEIYEAADTVLSWVGEPDEASTVALELIRTKEFRSPKILTTDDGEWKVSNPDTLPARLAALYRFLQRPYFRRIWVIQELAAASHPTLIIGKEMLEWRLLDMAAYHLSDILHQDSDMAARMVAADSKLQRIEDRELAYVRKLFYFRHLRVRGADDPMRMYTAMWPHISDSSPGILDACVLARDFESTLPHDKVFAVWNLAMDVGEEMIVENEFKLDYNIPLAEMYTQFVVGVTKHTGSLDIICCAEKNQAMVLGLVKLPSWVPDWSLRSEVSCMVRREHIPNRFMKVVHDIGGRVYHCSSFQPIQISGAEQKFDFITTKARGQMRLEVAGAVLDTIKVLGAPAFNLDGDNRSILADWLSIVAENCDREPSSVPETKKLYQKQFWSMVAGEVTGVWGVEEVKGPTGESWLGTVCLVSEEEAEWKDGKRGRRHGLMNTSVDIHRIITRGRRLAITEKGYMALVPWYAGLGMSLAILNACSAPMILELCGDSEEGNGKEIWRSSGSAFVQGWMEGEMLSQYGDTDEKAWTEIDRLGRLIIV
jgi:hypothetical protein